ncbi:MAG: Gfo/Idh/MocA family oxidoreductase, partial [bacterium]|nr:Gfo/Idh/MocA family oxidoreductase [bacterium]
MANYRAAVIGLGRMGSTFDDEIDQGGAIFLPYCHGPTYAAAPNIDLVAGTDPHDEQRAIFGERWGLSSDHLYSDYREMLEKENLDLVSVCTTARIRSEIVQTVAQSGVKGIWAEKPIALSLQEADAMVHTCRKNNVAIAINCSRRYNPYFEEARRIIQDGELGQVLQITAYAQCGLSHNGSHAIDTLRYLAGGNVEWVFGELESDEIAQGENDPQGNGYLVFDNGVRVYLRAMSTGCVYWEFDVIGEKGRLRSLSGSLE